MTKSSVMRGSAVFAALILYVAAAVPSAQARVLKSIGKSLQSEERSFTIGSGLDYQSDDEESEYDFSLIAEYGINENLKIAFEPNYIELKQGETTTSGFGEFEASLNYDFFEFEESEIGLSALTLIKMPTASKSELGTGEPDVTLGLGVSREFERIDADFEALYTFVGDPPGVQLQNSVEFVVSSEWYATRMLSLMAELAVIDGAGRSHNRAGNVQGLAGREGGSERSVTFGLAESIGRGVRLEQGVVYALDGTFQAVVAWEWALGGW